MEIKNWKLKIIVNWPLAGLFLFAFIALIASLSIFFNTKGALVATKAPLVAPLKIEEKNARAFLWKDGEIPYAVIIDNMKDAWPPQGLEYARVVFEAPVEAGITRLLAIFGSDEESDFEIGPVRSARPYFVDWAEEFGTVLAHVGGSPEALEKIKDSRKIYDLDEFRYGNPYFIRSPERYAPHNTFTSLELLKKFFNKVSRQKRVEFNEWKTKESDQSPGHTSILISYPDPYEVRWEYEKTTNDYLRVIRAKPFLTMSGKEVRASNVVVMKTDITIIDNISRRKIITAGSGEALIFQDGKVIKVKWRKEDGYTKFYNEEGTPATFNKGPVWVEVVSVNTQIEY